MAQVKIKEIKFPLLGVGRRDAYQDGADRPRDAFTTPWAMGVRPQDPLELRFRGGSFPSTGVPTPPAPTPDYLLDEAGGFILDEVGAGVEIVADTTFQWNVPGGDPTSYPSGTTSSSSNTSSTLPIVQATVGNVPDAWTFGATYRDRLMLAGRNSLIYCSRQGGHTDWNYGAAVEDGGRAIVFQAAEAQELGATVTALVPHKDNHLLIATANTLWVLAGDPSSGSLRNVSRNVGMVGNLAWTKIEDRIVFLAADGLYGVNADGSDLKSMSKERVPNELRSVGSTVTMQYVQDDRGVYIYMPSGSSYNWFYDVVAGGFWPFVTSSTTSHVLLGPIRMAAPGSFGRVLNLKGSIGTGSGTVNWAIVPGDSAELASENGKAAIGGTTGLTAASGTFAAGQSHLSYPRVRAPWIVLWLSSTQAWAYENITLELAESGKWR